jgi:LysR family transcriptional activator of nhaA
MQKVAIEILNTYDGGVKWLNYNHLFYFWMVAREGSVVDAAKALMVSQPTVSIQLKALERTLGHRLFDRTGRKLKLTDAGRIAFNYANDMFLLSRDLTKALDRQPTDRPLKMAVGIADVIPKRVVRRLLEPALALKPGIRLICTEDSSGRLLADLAEGRLDVVLSDAPIGTGVHIQGFNHLLSESGTSFLAKANVATKYRRGFPKSLDGAPMLLPSDHTTVRQGLNAWFDSKHIHPQVMGEFDDAALMLTIGQEGTGIFPFPSIAAEQAQKELGVVVVGVTESVRERFYAISVEEQPKHPAVAAICKGTC